MLPKLLSPGANFDELYLCPIHRISETKTI